MLIKMCWFRLNKKIVCVFFVFNESIVTIVDTIQFFPKAKTCLGFSRANVLTLITQCPLLILPVHVTPHTCMSTSSFRLHNYNLRHVLPRRSHEER